MDSHQYSQSNKITQTNPSKQLSHTHSRALTGTRSFDFQNPNKYVIELKGKCNPHPRFEETKEKKQFRTIQVHDLPDSKRTIVPDLAPQPSSMRSKSSTHLKHNSDSKEFNYISNIMLPTRRHPVNSKVYRSFDLTNSNTPVDHKREIKSVCFKKYDTTSQITNLPGCIKRNPNEINDDKGPKIIPDNQSHYYKRFRDHRSNVLCLPGCLKNPYKIKDQDKLIRHEHLETDIFNVKGNSTVATESTLSTLSNGNTNTNTNTNGNVNTFNVSSRRENYNRIFSDSSSSDVQSRGITGIRRATMRNKSQFQIV